MGFSKGHHGCVWYSCFRYTSAAVPFLGSGGYAVGCACCVAGSFAFVAVGERVGVQGIANDHLVLRHR